MAAAGWKTDGLPAHMVAGLPHTAEVQVQGQTIHVQLECDGVPLTRADVRGWRAGEAEGWRPTPIKASLPCGDVHDIHAEELHDD